MHWELRGGHWKDSTLRFMPWVLHCSHWQCGCGRGLALGRAVTNGGLCVDSVRPGQCMIREGYGMGMITVCLSNILYHQGLYGSNLLASWDAPSALVGIGALINVCL